MHPLHAVAFYCKLKQKISALFQLELHLGLKDAEWAMPAVVGHEVVVAFENEAFQREVRGMVRSVRQITTEPTGLSRYKLLVVPPLWMTTRRKDHRIFKNLSVPEIVADVIRGYGGTIPAPVSVCSGDHPRREYTVQYGETDKHFIFRLLAEEGIASFFDHENQSAFTLVDDTTVFTPALANAVPFVPASGETFTAPHIQRVTVESNLTTSTAAIRDYAYDKPQFLLQAQADTAGGAPLYKEEAVLATYEFEVGQFHVEKEGQARAERILQEARTRSRLLHCTASFAIAPGTRISMFDHPRSEVNGDVLVIRSMMELDGEQSPLS